MTQQKQGEKELSQYSNIFLIGFMGTGKSTVSRLLSTILEMDAVEMDQMLEERAGMSISEIFDQYGEEHFRRMETELAVEMQSRSNLVVSCGGGVPMRQENVEAMRKSGAIVLLTASPETIYDRVKNSHNRPVIEQNKNIPFIASLMEQRREKYEAAADFIIETDGKSAEQICQEIVQRVKEKEQK